MPSGTRAQNRIRAAAVVVAAGQSRRMRLPTRKQFLLLEEIPVLVHTLRVFESSLLIREVCLVVPRGTEAWCRREILKKYQLKKVKGIVAGGKTRQDSVYRGLRKISPKSHLIVIHDGVRPFLTLKLLNRAIRICRSDGGVVTALPLRDTPKYVGQGGIIKSTIDRSGIFLAQTPQVFARKILMEAYRRAYTDGVTCTDDSALVERLGYHVRVLEGNVENFKITTAEDLRLAGRILEDRRFRR